MANFESHSLAQIVDRFGERCDVSEPAMKFHKDLKNNGQSIVEMRSHMYRHFVGDLNIGNQNTIFNMICHYNIQSERYNSDLTNSALEFLTTKDRLNLLSIRLDNETYDNPMF